MHTYIVTQGDSLYSISQKFGVSADSIIHTNRLKKASSLAVGQALVIPVYMLTVTVHSGQTVASIARGLQVSPADILRQNPTLSGVEALSPGRTFTITFPTRKKYG